MRPELYFITKKLIESTRIIKILIRFDEYRSTLLRKIFKGIYDIEVGLHSYGCFDIKRIPRGTIIGRYCSFSRSCYIFNRNHGLTYLSTHPYFYNKNLGFIEQEVMTNSVCTIEDDVWLGHNVIVLPSVKKIGRGSVIGAGTVVTKDVPAYSIFVGNPGHVVKYRFNEKMIEVIENSKWWEIDYQELKTIFNINKEVFYIPSEDISNYPRKGK